MEFDWNFVISMVGHDRSHPFSGYAKFSEKLTLLFFETLSLLFLMVRLPDKPVQLM